jgi:hypothetical protein
MAKKNYRAAFLISIEVCQMCFVALLRQQAFDFD